MTDVRRGRDARSASRPGKARCRCRRPHESARSHPARRSWNPACGRDGCCTERSGPIAICIQPRNRVGRRRAVPDVDRKVSRHGMQPGRCARRAASRCRIVVAFASAYCLPGRRRRSAGTRCSARASSSARSRSSSGRSRRSSRVRWTYSGLFVPSSMKVGCVRTLGGDARRQRQTLEPIERLGNAREIFRLAGQAIELHQQPEVRRCRMRRQRIRLVGARSGGFQVERVLQCPAWLRRPCCVTRNAFIPRVIASSTRRSPSAW